METFRVTLDLYRRVFSRALALAGINWPVVSTVFLYSGILLLGSWLAAPFGLLGGFAFSALWAACASSFLYLVDTMIRTTRVTLADVKSSFGAYLGEVLGVAFALWVLLAILGPALARLPQGQILGVFAGIVVFVFFNAVPELIYLGRFGVLDLLRESYLFVGDNWIEWFPATLAFLTAYLLINLLPDGGLAGVLTHLLTAALAYLAMLVRGLLFLELHSSSRRGRAFKLRMRADG